MGNVFNIIDRNTLDFDLSLPGVGAPRLLVPAAYTNVTTVANQAFIARFKVSRNMTITKIAFVTTTAAGSDDAVDVGIFSGDLTTKLVSSGATTGVINGTAGVKAITVTATALTAGTVYYAALSVGAIGGTACVIQGTNINTGNNAALFGASVPNIFQGIKATAHPLATSTIGSPTVNSQTVVFGIRES